jgi:hypothetical protein
MGPYYHTKMTSPISNSPPPLQAAGRKTVFPVKSGQKGKKKEILGRKTVLFKRA